MRFVLYVILYVVGLTSCHKKEELLLKKNGSVPKAINIIKPRETRISDTSRTTHLAFENETQKGYRIIYKTHFQGQEINAFGIIVIPKDNKPHPILSYQHGTIMAQVDTPYESLDPNHPYSPFISHGYIVVAPDYIGYHKDSLVHPYFLKNYYANCILDLLKAATTFLSSQNIPYLKDLYLVGYSEGGFATMDAHQALEERTNERNGSLQLKLKASVCLAGAYDLPELVSTLYWKAQNGTPETRGVAMSFLGYLIQAYDQYVLKKGVHYYYNEPYCYILSHHLTNFYNGLWGQPMIAKLWASHIEADPTKDVFTTKVTHNKAEDLMEALEKNNFNNWKPQAPLLLVHSVSDDIVAYSSIQQTYNAIKMGGGNVELLPITDGSLHETMLSKSFTTPIDYFNQFKELSTGN